MAKWFYSAGSAWVPFDAQSTRQIETLWRNARAAWIYVGSFRAQAYVNGPGLSVNYNGYNYPICRR
ncbi:hypothetical protein DM01DRAFT_1330758 [Hesseltinella vesiculosa]|uniref:WWE domain-containing protein n=1 Tax=Hesseltinella vesiculosa TaxID=101127 RepID=A0A1X2GX19_9FUNG|nr:hypothetical protein DM01DRAFT_1330758 [Hesseltinella vesiculosa]